MSVKQPLLCPTVLVGVQYPQCDMQDIGTVCLRVDIVGEQMGHYVCRQLVLLPAEPLDMVGLAVVLLPDNAAAALFAHPNGSIDLALRSH